MPRRFASACMLCVALLCGTPALAQGQAQQTQTQTPQLPPDVQARMPAALEFVQVMRMTDLMRDLLPAIWQQLVTPLLTTRNDPQVKAAVDAVGPIIIAEMTKELQSFANLLAAIYARNFSEEELKDLTGFMRTSTGQKFVGKQGELAQAGMAAGQQWGQQLMARMQPRIDEELRKRLPPR